MRKILIAAIMAAVIGAVAGAQGATVTIQNQEDTTLYYMIDPKELAGLSAGSPLLASKVAAYFSASDSAATFAALAPQAEAKLVDLADGTHMLVGFFAEPDADDFPVRVVAVQADSSVGERFYALFASPSQLRVRRGIGKLAQFGRPAPAQGTTVASGQSTGGSAQTGGTSASGQTGGGAAAAGGTASAVGDELPEIATFSAAYDPTVFTKENARGFNVLPIEESRSWKQTGTRVSEVRGTADTSGLRLTLTVPGGFSPAVSYFLYFFDTRSSGRENPVTLEIEPLARPDRGACILWQKGSPARLLGTVKTSGTTVELTVGKEELDSGALSAAGNEPTVDLTACWYDKALQMWEEFYYTTFPAPAPPSAG